jgi:hypothetical protein
MPLIPQQEIVTVDVLAKFSIEVAAQQLKKKLESYPPSRIVSISHLVMNVPLPSQGRVQIIAVIETI